MMKVILTYLVACTTQPHVQSLNLNLEPSTELSNQGIEKGIEKGTRILEGTSTLERTSFVTSWIWHSLFKFSDCLLNKVDFSHFYKLIITFYS